MNQPQGQRRWFFTGLQLAVGFLFGVVIWIMSPRMSGEVEPWDSMSSYYTVSLMAAGLTVSFPRPSGAWAGTIGVLLGQISYLECLPTGSGAVIFPAPLAILVIGTWQVVVGGIVGAVVGKLARIIVGGPVEFAKQTNAEAVNKGSQESGHGDLKR